MAEDAWKVGMAVAICGTWPNEGPVPDRIKTVGKRFLLLERDTRKFRLNGFLANSERADTYIKPLTAMLCEEIVRGRYIRLIKGTDLKSLSVDQLSRIAGIVGKEKRGEDYKPEFVYTPAEVKDVK